MHMPFSANQSECLRWIFATKFRQPNFVIYLVSFSTNHWSMPNIAAHSKAICTVWMNIVFRDDKLNCSAVVWAHIFRASNRKKWQLFRRQTIWLERQEQLDLQPEVLHELWCARGKKGCVINWFDVVQILIFIPPAVSRSPESHWKKINCANT